jgi:hypothetical protein
MKTWVLVILCVGVCYKSFGWGFYGHRMINYHAVFLLPPEMMLLYKPHIRFITDHAVDPDKRRYAVKNEGPRHYIDMDQYGSFPFDTLPRSWPLAVGKFSEDSLMAHGIVPWHIQVMLQRLTKAFRDMNEPGILKLSAEIGHYIADSHVPLHASSNHNGQFTGQRGIHGFWESRIPELLAEKEWDFFAGRAQYLKRPLDFCWKKVIESSRAADSVLRIEKELDQRFPSDAKYAFEDRNGTMIKQYSTSYSKAYNDLLNGMVERRLKESIHAVASFWYTAWVNAGQPDLRKLEDRESDEEDLLEFADLNKKWQEGAVIGKSCE